jgi:integrase
VPVRMVSERLGHASVACTMNVYQHVFPGMRGRAIWGTYAIVTSGSAIGLGLKPFHAQ